MRIFGIFGMVLSCVSCGVICFLQSKWSSQSTDDSRTFEVNIRTKQVINSIGKGPTALNNFWATMNISHQGLHQKTYKKYLKKIFKPAAETEMHTRSLTDAVEAVKNVHTEMETTFSKNITAVYDVTWLAGGHSSHTGVGLEIACAVLSTFCPRVQPTTSRK